MTSPRPRWLAMSAIWRAAEPAKYLRGTSSVGRSMPSISRRTWSASSDKPRKMSAFEDGSAVSRSARLSIEEPNPAMATFSLA